ncbi:MAG: hypothetical protein Q9163_003189 [Psora crenata]
MTSKRVLIGPIYHGFVDSEDDTELLMRTYIKSKLFCPSQQPQKQNVARLIRSGYTNKRHHEITFDPRVTSTILSRGPEVGSSQPPRVFPCFAATALLAKLSR